MWLLFGFYKGLVVFVLFVLLNGKNIKLIETILLFLWGLCGVLGRKFILKYPINQGN